MPLPDCSAQSFDRLDVSTHRPLADTRFLVEKKICPLTTSQSTSDWQNSAAPEVDHGRTGEVACDQLIDVDLPGGNGLDFLCACVGKIGGMHGGRLIEGLLEFGHLPNELVHQAGFRREQVVAHRLF